MSRCNCGRAREEAFNMLGFNSEKSEQQKALAEICKERFLQSYQQDSVKLLLSMSSIVV